MAKEASKASTATGAMSGEVTVIDKTAQATGRRPAPSVKAGAGALSVVSGATKGLQLKNEGHSTQASIAGGTATAATGTGIVMATTATGAAIGNLPGAAIGAAVGVAVDLGTGASDNAGNAVADSIDNPGKSAMSEGCTVRTSAGGCD